MSNLGEGCELLQKVYLCSNTNNHLKVSYTLITVVNCFKKCIFAVIQTTAPNDKYVLNGL